MPTPSPACQYEQVTDLDPAIMFGTDVTVPENATAAMLQAEGADIRFTCDGSTPTGTLGMVLINGDAPILVDSKQAIRNLKAFGAGTLNIQFLGNG